MKWTITRQVLIMSKYAIFGTLIQCLAFNLLLGNNSMGQVKSMDEIYLSFKGRNIDLKSLFLKIEVETGFEFTYFKSAVNEKMKVDFVFEDESLSNILRKVSSVANLKFKRVNEKIYVNKKDDSSYDVLEVINEQPAQTRTVTGKVTSKEDVEGLPGVNVIEKNTSNGTVTDIQGNYTLEVSEGATLVFSSVGYTTVDVVVGNQSVVDVTLNTDIRQLEELVVVGYGTQKRGDLTGSVSSIKMEDSPVSMIPNTNILSALRATTPGLNIGTVNTAGGSPSLLIRGQNSLSASNTPLIVVDGVVFLGNVGDLNPADIASADILKDASSTAVYGSRAANGVIIFTTKKGKTEKPILSFSSSAGVYVWNTKPEMISLEQQIERTKYNTGLEDPLDWMYPNDAYNYEHGIVTHWPDHFSRTGNFFDNQLSVSGGKDKINYYMSAGYTDQNGVIVGDDYNRKSLRGSINTDITNWLEINLDGSFNRSDYSGIGASINTYMMGDSYWSPFRGYPEDNTGLLEKWPRSESRPGHVSDNPLWLTQDNVADDVDITDSYRLATSALIDVPFIKGLSYRLNFVTNLRQAKAERFIYEDHFVAGGPMWNLERYSPEVLQGYLSLANGSVSNRTISNYVVDNILNYRRELNRHSFDVTLVATRDYQSDRSFTMLGSDFKANGNTLLGIDGIALGANQTISNAHTEFSNIGYLARVNYIFNERYHFTSSIRRDGSSVFGKDNKWGNFPSVGIAWTISEEDFLSMFEFINYLKIRASYGKNGNQGISPYETLARVRSGRSAGLYYQWGNQPGISQYGMAISSLGNSALGWETTTSFNVGIETALLKQRIFMDLDFYFSKTIDQLFTRQIPAMTGFTTIRASMGQVDNKGIEISLRTINIEASNIQWSSHLTFWQNRNILAELYGDGKDDLANNLFIRKSLGAIYGYEFAGIVQSGDTEYIQATGARPGDVKWKDLNGDVKITASEDRKILGYTKENFRLNLSNTVKYHNFELYVHLSGIFGGSGNNWFLGSNPSAYLSGDVQAQMYHPLAKISYWTPDNPSNKYPSPHYVDSAFRGYQSRTFVRVQDITLSHNFNYDWVNNMNISGLKVFTSIQHLYTFTGWDGDPESGVGAISSTYPVPASFTVGLNVRF